MEWFSQNWLWVIIGIVFVGMHMFGHGGHGGHNRTDKPGTDTADSDKSSSHRH